MVKLKSKLVIVVIVILGIIAFMSCEKNSKESSLKSENVKDRTVPESIKNAEKIAKDYRLELAQKSPSIQKVWDEMGYSFDESQLSPIVDLESNIRKNGDINVSGKDQEGNTYSLLLTSKPYDKEPINKCSTNVNARWPTANEWVCLTISTAASVMSLGMGLFGSVANLAAMCAVESEKSCTGYDPSIYIHGFYNGNLEFSLNEDVYTAADGEIHMDAYLTIKEVQNKPFFTVNGLINTMDDTQSASFIDENGESISTMDVVDPIKYTSIPLPLLSIINSYQNKAPYTIKSSRNAIQGELIRLLKTKL